jgi:hypothetical protein
MADLVRYTSPAAVASAKKFQRFGAETRLAGISSRRTLIDGFLVLTNTTKNGSLTVAVDIDAYLVWCSRDSFDGFNTVYFGVGAIYGQRIDYTPGGTPKSPRADLTKLRRVVPSTYQFLGWDYGVETAGANRAYNHGLPAVDGGWLYGTPSTPVEYHAGEELFDRDLVMTLWGVRWSADTPLAPVDNALVILGERKTSKNRVVSIPTTALAALAGRPGVRSWQQPNNVFRFNAAVQTKPVDGEPPTKLTSAYVATGGADFEQDDLSDRAVLVVGRVDLDQSETEAQAAWGSVVDLRLAYDGSVPLNVLEGIGIHAGDDVSVCAVAHDDFVGGAAQPTFSLQTVTLDADTGAVLNHTEFSNYPTYSTPICTTTQGVWVASAEMVDDVLESPRLFCVKSGVSQEYDLDGWTPISALAPGLEASTRLWTRDCMTLGVVELGQDRVGVLACPPGTYTPTSNIAWSLLEVDINTRAVVAPPKLVGNATLNALSTLIPKPIALTVVTQQRVVDGVVVVPAVLLSTVGLNTRLSVDGGETWESVATGIRGYPYYFGNKLHAFEFGVSV